MFDIVPFRRNNLDNKRGDVFDRLVDNFFNDDFFAPNTVSTFGNSFKVDLKETDTSYIIEADLPGINKENINLEFNNNYLTVSAKREDSLENKDENYIRRERRYGEFRRSFYIDNVDENNIHASFKEGILTINLPKVEKNNNSRKKIDIK